MILFVIRLFSLSTQKHKNKSVFLRGKQNIEDIVTTLFNSNKTQHIIMRLQVHLSLVLLSILLLCLQDNFNLVECTSPDFLWKVINTTIEKKTPTKDSDWNPLNCPRIVFHTDSKLAGQKYIGHKSVPVDVSELTSINSDVVVSSDSVSNTSFVFPNLTYIKEFLAFESNWTIMHGDENDPEWSDSTAKKLYEPCITVVSIVNGTNMYFNKMDLASQLLELLQYNTPVRNRHLILVRLADHDGQLFDCSVFKGSSDFPVRLMSQWEMLLFDFFTDARVIQGLVEESTDLHQNTLRVGYDPGLWVWVCDDMIETLEKKKQCLKTAKKGEDCRIFKRSIPDTNRNKTCVGGFSPRH